MITQKNLCPVCYKIQIGDFKMSTHLVAHTNFELAEVVFDEVRQAGYGYCLACDHAVVASFDASLHVMSHSVEELAEAIFKIMTLMEAKRDAQKFELKNYGRDRVKMIEEDRGRGDTGNKGP